MAGEKIYLNDVDDLGITVAKQLNNIVVVNSKSDFPTPAGGKIVLVDNKSYQLGGAIALGTDYIEMGASNVIFGVDRSTNGLVYTGTGAAIRSVDQNLTIDRIFISATTAGGTIFDMIGDLATPTNLLLITDCILTGSKSVGEIKGGYGVVVVRGCLFDNNDVGIVFSGDSTDLVLADNIFQNFNGTPTFVDIQTATYSEIIISRNTFGVATGQTGLNISASLVLNDGGLLESNSFTGAGTRLAGIDASSPGWRIPSRSNIGIAGLFTTSRTVVLGTFGTTTSNTWLSVAQQVLTKNLTSDYEEDATEIKGAVTVGITHDDSSGLVGYRLFNFTDSVPVGFSGTTDSTKADVDIIAWQNTNIVRFTFNGAHDLSNINVGDTITVISATNASNNGSFIITTVNDGSDYIEAIVPARTDATDDEGAGSPGEAYGGSFGYLTITTGGVYEVDSSPEMMLELGKEYRVQLLKLSGTGSANVLVNAGDLDKKIF